MKDLDLDLTDRHVLIVEDIVDSGLTLAYLRKNLRARNPASLEVCALLVKEGLQKTDPDLKYVGFTIPESVRDRLRPRRRRALSQSAVRGRVRGGSRAGMTVDQARSSARCARSCRPSARIPTATACCARPRVAEMYAEICSGLTEDPAKHLVVTFEADHDEMVLVRDIALYSVCVPSKEKGGRGGARASRRGRGGGGGGGGGGGRRGQPTQRRGGGGGEKKGGGVGGGGAERACHSGTPGHDHGRVG